LDLARKFCGYLAILHDLEESEIRIDLEDELSGKVVALEIVYFIVFRMTETYQSLARCVENLLDTKTINSNPYVVFYALEVVYRCVRKKQHLTWNLPDHHILHPLVSLENS